MTDEKAPLQLLLKQLEHPELRMIDLSLDRMKYLLEKLGNPEKNLPPVIHVAGTNGKGSLLTYLTAIFQAAGYRVHRYTSPHLVEFNERMMLNGKAISTDKLMAVLREVQAQIKEAPATFFEATTAAAFLAFAREPADILLLETGLGGRLDATNVVASPLLTVITPIGMDHTEYLGNSLPEIAREKAGILKSGVRCVVGPQEPATLVELENKARLLSVPLYRHGVEWEFYESEKGGFAFRQDGKMLDALIPSLPGAHQYANAATAVACCLALSDYFAIPESAIAQGLANARWPGRLQHITHGYFASLLSNADKLWLDGGHNPHAAKILADWAKRETAKDGKIFCVILGMLNGKDSAGFIGAFETVANALVAIPIAGENHQPMQALVALAKQQAIPAWEAADVSEAVALLKQRYHAPLRILITGSLYLAGSVLKQNS